jgi:hypothetical protein
LKKLERHQLQGKRLDEQVLAYLRKNESTTVEQLYDVLRSGTPSLTKDEVVNLVWQLVERGEASVEDVPPAARSIREYLSFWQRNLSFYLPLVASLATLLVVYLAPSSFPLIALRWVLGSMFVLFLPGYMAVEALFPKGRELDVIERFALSVGLSLALVPLVGLLLNYTPWGIRLDPIMTSLISLTIGLSLIALARRYRLSVERFELQQFS